LPGNSRNLRDLIRNALDRQRGGPPPAPKAPDVPPDPMPEPEEGGIDLKSPPQPGGADAGEWCASQGTPATDDGPVCSVADALANSDDARRAGRPYPTLTPAEAVDVLFTAGLAWRAEEWQDALGGHLATSLAALCSLALAPEPPASIRSNRPPRPGRRERPRG
jgi:hypothetical protein